MHRQGSARGLVFFVNHETILFMVKSFLISLFISLIPFFAFGASVDHSEIHQTANWLGDLKQDPETKKYEVTVAHQLKGTKLPETEKWVDLKKPLKIKLFKKDAMKVVKATRYYYSFGCDSPPTYELQISENLNPKDWSFAAPENKSVSWAEDNQTFKRTKSQPIQISDLPEYEWERLTDKLSYVIIDEFPQSKKPELIAQIRKQGVRAISGLRTERFLALIFADLSFDFTSQNSKGQKINKKFSVHRAYRMSATGGFDEIPSPWASGLFWAETFAPNQGIYMNTIDQLNLVLKTSGSLQSSVYFLTNFHGVPLEHNFSFPETCD